MLSKDKVAAVYLTCSISILLFSCHPGERILSVLLWMFPEHKEQLWLLHRLFLIKKNWITKIVSAQFASAEIVLFCGTA